MFDDYYRIYHWSEKTFLIVEDDISSIFLLKEILKDTNVNLFIVENGKDAVEKCQNNPNISLVIMDIQLPGMDGYEATRLIKKEKPQLPVLAQTAYGFEEDKRKCFESGCDDYISKPLDPITLLEKISSIIDKN